MLVPSSGVATGTRWFPHLAPIAFKPPCPKHRTQQQERASAGGSNGGRTTVPSCAYALSLFVSPIQITAAAAMPIARVSSGHGHPTATQRCDGPRDALSRFSLRQRGARSKVGRKFLPSLEPFRANTAREVHWQQQQQLLSAAVLAQSQQRVGGVECLLPTAPPLHDVLGRLSALGELGGGSGPAAP